MKKCPSCKQELPLTSYSVRPNGRPASYCKKCQRECCRRHYRKHCEAYKERKRKVKEQRRKEATEFVRNKKAAPCMDCGNTFHYSAMDFDHVKPGKTATVSQLMNAGASIEKIQEELDLCELVCANCHRVRTWKRM